MLHQYVERDIDRVVAETLFGDRVVDFLYSTVRERAPWMFRALTGRRTTSLLGYLNFDMPLAHSLTGSLRFLRSHGIDLSECVEAPAALDTPRKVFQRRIRYWETRALPDDPRIAVSPADSKAIVGSFSEDSRLFIKDKFFDYDELFGEARHWRAVFEDGDFGIFRLSPESYHYTHAPVSGVVLDYFAVEGDYHACNPSAVTRLVTPFSKNRRVVSVFDTDVPGGTGLGIVALIEVVALMIGDVVPCYSSTRYESPVVPERGLFVERGQPYSRFQPGSSTDIVLFRRGQVRFAEDLVQNLAHPDAESRFSQAFGQPLTETKLLVRSPIAMPCAPSGAGGAR